jgi:DNA-binding transcriptional LysR family regulator
LLAAISSPHVGVGITVEFRELVAFVAIVEEGGLSAAARRLHISQPALSQTVNSLEREVAVQLLVRGSTGAQPTEAGMTFLAEARAVLARRDQALATMAELTRGGAGVLRLGIPLELDPDVLPRALARFTAKFPETRVVPRQLSTAAQFVALREDTLDVGLVRERPAGPEFDAMLVSRENLGILIGTELADELVGPDGVRLDALQGLKWVGFPRAGSPAWFDELTSTLRSHGIDIGPPVPDDLELVVAVKFASVGSGDAFALAPPRRLDQLPETVTWSPLVGTPLVRRTWAVWPASSRRRDVGHFITMFDSPGAG